MKSVNSVLLKKINILGIYYNMHVFIEIPAYYVLVSLSRYLVYLIFAIE